MGELIRVPEGRDREIVEKYQGGLTMAQIGEEFGITRQRVCQIFKRYGIAADMSRRGRKPTNPALMKKYSDRAVELGNKVQAAQEFGVSVDTIGRALRRAGISLRKTKFTSDKVKTDIISRYRLAESLSKIAMSYETRPQHINSLLRKWGVEPNRAINWKRKGSFTISQG